MKTANTTHFVWQHQCHGFLGVFSSMEDLIKGVTKAPYPVPDIQKLQACLQEGNSFSYAINLISIEKVDSTSNQ